MRAAKEKTLQTREATVAAAAAQNAQAEGKLGSAEAELIRIQTDKAALQAKLQAHEAEIAELRKRVEGSGAKDGNPDVLPMPGAGDLQTQLEETRRQLDSAEREKQLLSARIKTTERPGATRVPAPGRRTVVRSSTPGIRGSVLAVNQAYNFVVLSLGGRQGLEANTEMVKPNGVTACGPTTDAEQTCGTSTAGTYMIFVRDLPGTGTGGYTIEIS